MGHAIASALIVLEGVVVKRNKILFYLCSNLIPHGFIFLILFIPCNILAAEAATQNKTINQKKKFELPSSPKVVIQISSWKEKSLLQKTDGTKYKINTLNTAGRLGVQNYFWKHRLYGYYGVYFGQSKNASDDDSFSYYQRSVYLIGAELGLGATLYSTKTVDFIFSVNGLYRSINHTIPNEDYKFKTEKRTLPLALLELSWKLGDALYWNQSIGTLGEPLDTFWALGVGMNL